MGQYQKRNKAFSIPLLLKILDEVEIMIKGSDTKDELNRWLVFSCYATLAYVISLRGSEVFLLDLDGLNRHMVEDNKGYFVIGLLGKIKGENNEKLHLVPCSNVTSSGIKVKNTVVQLLKFKKKTGFISGPAITKLNGKPFETRDLNDMLLYLLDNIFVQDPSLFPTEVVN